MSNRRGLTAANGLSIAPLPYYLRAIHIWGITAKSRCTHLAHGAGRPLAASASASAGGGIFSFLPIAGSVPDDTFTPLWATPQNVDLEAMCRSARGLMGHGHEARRFGLQSNSKLLLGVAMPASSPHRAWPKPRGACPRNGRPLRCLALAAATQPNPTRPPLPFCTGPVPCRHARPGPRASRTSA